MSRPRMKVWNSPSFIAVGEIDSSSLMCALLTSLPLIATRSILVLREAPLVRSNPRGIKFKAEDLTGSKRNIIFWTEYFSLGVSGIIGF